MRRLARCGLFLLQALIIYNLSSCTSVRTVDRAGPRGKEPVIRVLIDSGTQRIRLSATGAFDLRTNDGRRLLDSSGPAEVIISSQASGLALQVDPSGRTADGGDEVRIVPRGDATFIYQGIAYAGSFTVARESGNKMAIVNTLPLETYLEGVLPNEIGVRGPDEFAALEAQAIAARTYALSRIHERSRGPFDVHASVMDQVYRGRKGANRLAAAAVKDTRGMVLTFGGKLASAYYCSCCGGHTSDIALMWPARADAPYLKGVRDAESAGGSSFCSKGRRFRWRYSWSGSELGSLLRETLPSVLGIERDAVGYLEDIAVTGRSRSGRVTALEITTSRGSFTVRGDRIRWALLIDRDKKRILPSTMFELTTIKEGGRVALISAAGGGNGHGVGMCQIGALEMARQGYTYEMILSHYYSGCSVERQY